YLSECFQRGGAAVSGRNRDRTQKIIVEGGGEDRRHAAHAMTERVGGSVAALSRKRDDPEHRIDAVVYSGEFATARSELMPRKVKAVDAETVAREERTEKVQVLFARRVAVAGNHGDAARPARFVPEHRDR